MQSLDDLEGEMKRILRALHLCRGEFSSGHFRHDQAKFSRDFKGGAWAVIDFVGSASTLQHGPIKNLYMDSMTMVFRVQNQALLKGIKIGDKVKFEAARVQGAITVIKLEKAK